MSNPTTLPAREFSTSAASMIVGIGAITTSAMAHQTELVKEDTSLTKAYLQDLKSRIDDAGQTILGHDNAKDLRDATADLHIDTHTALEALGSMLNTIKNKYGKDTHRRDEILTNLGFTALYTAASNKDQQAIGQLLSRANIALSAGDSKLAKELTAKGMNQSRIDTVNTLAGTYTMSNTGQEATKGDKKILSAADVAVLNGLYHETMIVAKTARHYFRNDSALRDLFVFSKVAPPSHGRDNIAGSGNKDLKDQAA
ncbi:MAG: hypothetical protein ABI378_05240 [Chitinophagaceae bacterium]